MVICDIVVPSYQTTRILMSKRQHTLPIRLFYSYCHKDERYRESMEKALALLKREQALNSWSDRSILPGQKISQKISKEMEESGIMVFLLSQNFIASAECLKEWENAKQLTGNGKLLFRIPIILEACSWVDMLGKDDIKALPKDGKPVSGFDSADAAWQQVYDGIKSVINVIKNNFVPKSEFLKEIEKTYFLSQQHIKLQDIFIFPLLCYAPQKLDSQKLEEKIINQDQLLRKKHVIIHGEEMSGKTAFGRHLFLSLVKQSAPVLHIDLEQVPRHSKENFLRKAYSSQFHGDYSLWVQKKDKTLILDNLSSAPTLIDFIVFLKDFFDRIIVTLSSDVFNSFFKDEIRLADFIEMKIEPLTHRQQESLVRKRIELSGREEPVTDGFIDHVEDRVNSIITVQKIVPRYPFYVLSILQTYEGYMPNNFSITSHGHCYYVLILANLIKAGISGSDKDINSCFNFAEKLAYRIYQGEGKHTLNTAEFERFVEGYTETYHISSAIRNRLTHHEFGIITKDGGFRTNYMYYFFLGRFLSKNREEHKIVIENMCKESYTNSNYLTLLFIIHHTDDNQIIDDILLITMCTLDAIRPAILNHEETKRFGRILADGSKNILSRNSVAEEREKERNARDIRDHQDESEEENEQTEHEEPVNDVYRILKNNEILGQVLRNKCGNLEKTKIEEIIEIIADSGLRLVNFVLKDEKEIAEIARYIQQKHPTYDIHRVEMVLRVFSFLWTMINVEKIVSAINHPEIRETVNEVVRRRLTPAYDLIGYFSQLDSTEKFTEEMKNKLGDLLKKHDDPFLKGVLSIRTQRYINTHRNKASIEQSICSLLGIKYLPRPVQ